MSVIKKSKRNLSAFYPLYYALLQGNHRFCLGRLISIFTSNLHIWRPFHYSQPVDPVDESFLHPLQIIPLFEILKKTSLKFTSYYRKSDNCHSHSIWNLVSHSILSLIHMYGVFYTNYECIVELFSILYLIKSSKITNTVEYDK